MISTTRRLRRIGFVALATIVVVVVAAGLLARWWWTGSVPSRSGTVELAGLSTPVAIHWDARGVPTIEGRSFEDALAGQGFVHGLLRPLQVELRRRAALGELAAIGGEKAIPLDQQALDWSYAESASVEEGLLSPAARRAVESYVRGLNAGLAAAGRRTQPGVRVTGARPQPWTVRDVIAFGRWFASMLYDATDAEVELLDLLVRLGPDDGATLWQAASESPAPPIPPALRDLLAKVTPGAPARPKRPFASMKMPKGSNAWAVSSRRSATGGALLAGDPHLEHELPATWFEVRLQWPGGLLAGASLPGAPGVLIGHNERVAWSFTVAATDDADLFLVEVDDENAPTRFRDAGAWRPFEIEGRRIAVRGAGDRELHSRRVGPAFYSGPSGIPGFGLLQRNAGREHHGLFEVVLGIDLAGSVGEAVAAARRFPGPGMNFLAADASGSITHAVVGSHPLRSGASWDGQLPDIWRGPVAWAGFAAPEQMPLALDPPEGFVASANDDALALRPPGPGQIPLRGDFYAPWRANRIRQRLAELPAAQPGHMVQLQLDTRAGSAADLAEEIRACAVRGPAADVLLGWTGEMDGAGAPLLHEVFRAALNHRVRTRTRLGEGFGRTNLALGLLRASRANPWVAEQWNDPETTWTESPCDQLRRALDEAWQDCRTHAGADPGGWFWPLWHELSLRSLAGVGPLGRLFNPEPIGAPGAADSVLAQAHRLPRDGWKGRPFQVVHGVSYRLVVEFDKDGRVRSRSAMPGGEDEHPRSPHAFDRLDDYIIGKLQPLYPADPSVSETITLIPG